MYLGTKATLKSTGEVVYSMGNGMCADLQPLEGYVDVIKPCARTASGAYGIIMRVRRSTLNLGTLKLKLPKGLRKGETAKQREKAAAKRKAETAVAKKRDPRVAFARKAPTMQQVNKATARLHGAKA